MRSTIREMDVALKFQEFYNDKVQDHPKQFQGLSLYL